MIPVNYQLRKVAEGGRWTKKEAMAEARAPGYIAGGLVHPERVG